MVGRFSMKKKEWELLKKRVREIADRIIDEAVKEMENETGRPQTWHKKIKK